MDRTTALTKIPTKWHATADAMAAEGLDWVSIILFIVKVVEQLLNRPKAAAPSHCDEHLKRHLCATREAACVTLCESIAACEAAGCCE